MYAKSNMYVQKFIKKKERQGNMNHTTKETMKTYNNKKNINTHLHYSTGCMENASANTKNYNIANFQEVYFAKQTLEQAQNCRIGTTFGNLFKRGVISANTTPEVKRQMDTKLCAYCYYFCSEDTSKIEAVYRQSALFNMKEWCAPEENGKTYGQNVLEQAKVEYSKMPLKNFINAPQWELEDDKGRPEDTLENLQALLRFEGINLKLNILTKEMECKLGDTPGFIAQKLYSMLKQYKAKFTLKALDRALMDLVNLNMYNPVAEWLQALKPADEDTEIKKVFNCLELADGQNADFCYMLFKRWLVTCYKIANNVNGTECAQGLFILQGPQGVGKTTFLQKLSPRPEWTCAGMAINPLDKNDLEKASKYWLVEVGEINATIKTSQAERLKNFFTNGKDVYRLSYGRRAKEFPRITAFYGTVNNMEFLRDLTGNRRYWVVSVDNIDLATLSTINTSKLWQEVKSLAIGGYASFLSRQELQQLEHHLLKYVALPNYIQVLLNCLDWTATENAYCWQKASQIAINIKQQYNITIRDAETAKGLRYIKDHFMDITMYLKTPRRGETNPNKKLYFVPPVLDPQYLYSLSRFIKEFQDGTKK